MKKKIFYSILALAAVAFSLASCSDVPEPYGTPQVGAKDNGTPQGDGLTAATAFNVAAINAMLDSGFSTDDSPSNPFYFIKGIICSRPSITTNYGNATYYISDDGTSNNQFYIYRSYDVDSVKFTDTNKLGYGDTVVVHSQVYSYSGTYETRSNTCKLVSVKKASGGGDTPTPTGNEITSAKAKELALALESGGTSTEQYTVTGYITSIVGSVSNNQQSFWMADTKDGGQVFEAYWANVPSTITEFKVGMKIKMTGYLMNYKGTTAEMKNGTVTIEEEGGGGGTGSGTGTQTDPYDVTKAIAVAASLQKSSTSASYLSDECFVKGKISKITDTAISSYGNLTYYISEDGSTTADQLEVYRGFGLGGAKFTDITDLKVGDEVVVDGKLQNWLGTYEFTSGSKLYSLNGKTSGGDTPTPTPTGSGTVTISGTTVTLSSGSTEGASTVQVDLNTLGLTNAGDAGTVTLSDGSTIVFGAGTNSSSPKFYTATKGVRVYGNNTMTFNCKSPIAKIVMTCDSYNGQDYVGQTTATVSFSGNTAVYTNAGSGTTQLRVQTITIYYAGSAAKRTYRFRR